MKNTLTANHAKYKAMMNNKPIQWYTQIFR